VSVGIGGILCDARHEHAQRRSKHASRPLTKIVTASSWAKARRRRAGRIGTREKARRANLLRSRGYGNTADAHHITSLARRRRRGALHEDGAPHRRLEYPGTFPTSTPTALPRRKVTPAKHRHQDVFRRLREKAGRSSTKRDRAIAWRGRRGGMTACVLAISIGIVPPTINLQTPDAEWRLITFPTPHAK